MALTKLGLGLGTACILLLGPLPAAANSPGGGGSRAVPEAAAPAPAEPAAAEAEGELVPPKPLVPIEVPYPEGAPPLTEAVEVEVVLQIDEKGQVAKADLVRGAGPPWDDAVLAACKGFQFEPARWNGEPAAVEIPFVQRFAPPETEAARGEEAKLDAAIEGEVLEMGTRHAVPAGVVQAEVDGKHFRAEADAGGRFSLRIPPGAAQVEVEVPGYKRFVVREHVEEGQVLKVRYLVERISYNPFEQIVVGKAMRQEVTRTTLRDREIRRVPGTFGDPFRVVGTMPGVGQMFSLLDYPIIRGASPGSSGILLDGDRIPQLFHFLAGPAVIHPEFLDRVDFYPGAFPIEYGGYTGGIVDGITRSGLPEEKRVEVGIDLLSSSLFLRQPFLGATGTLAGRYGYPAMLLSAFSENAFASYWDYQGRLDGRAGDGRWTLFLFGSFDEFGETSGGQDEVTAASLFHRVKLRWIEGDDASFDRYEIGFGYDELLSGTEITGEDDEEDPFDPTSGGVAASNSMSSWVVHPRASWRRPLTKSLAVHGGVDLSWQRNVSQFRVEQQEGELVPPNWIAQAGAFVETPWWLTEDLLVTPGLRSDVWETDDTRRYSLDPRLNARLRVARTDDEQIWLKSGIGIFHQPPRPPVSLPGAGELLLREGLPAAVQTTLGTELDFATGYLVDLNTYFNYMDPIFFDLEVNGSSTDEGFEANDAQTGRSYGVELLLRKRDNQGPFFGWISYTLSRSERQTADGWKPFDFDRSHMLQLVGSIRLPRDWELGARFQAISGRPVNQWDEPLNRAAPFTRFDLRIDKRAVYRSWMLDFYVELINAMISREQVAEGSDTAIPYIFPTVGFKAVL